MSPQKTRKDVDESANVAAGALDARRGKIDRPEAAETGREGRDDAEGKEEGSGSSLQKSLRELVVITTHAMNEGGRARAHARMPHAVEEMDAPPAIVYATSSDSDASTLASSHSEIECDIFHPFGASRRNTEPIRQGAVYQLMVDDRDRKIASLEAARSSDTHIIEEMKNTIQKLVGDKEEAELTSLREIAELKHALKMANSNQKSDPAVSLDNALQIHDGDADFLASLQEMQNEALQDKCARVQGVITSLEARNSDQENVIEHLKAEMVKLLVTKRMIDEELDREMEGNDLDMAKMRSSFQGKEEALQQIIARQEASISSYEDELEALKAGNVRLQITSRLMEGRKEAAEEEARRVNDQVQMFYVQKSHYAIL